MALKLALPLALACAGCSSTWLRRAPALPPLPEVSAEKFLPAVRVQVEKALDHARANPGDAAANGRLGMVLQAHDQFGAAAVCYRRAHLLDSSSFEWLYYLGLTQAELGNNAEAAATLEQAVRRKPDYLPARLKLAEKLMAAGKAGESEKLYEKIAAQHGDSAAARYGLGRVRAARGDTAGAAESYQRAVELFPTYGASHYALAQSLRRLGQQEQARQHLALYEKHKDSVPPAGDTAMAAVRELAAGAVIYIRQGVEAEQAGRLEEAAAAHEKAIEVDPNLVQAHVNLISLYGRLGRPEKAEEHYRAAARLNPNQSDLHYNYGVLVFGQGRLREAAEAFDETLRINPFHAEAHNNLGYLREQQGRAGEAVAHYRKAIENRPDYRLAHFHLGRVLVNRRNFKEGIEHLQKTLTSPGGAPVSDDESTPGFLYALASAYARSGDRASALPYARKAREQAAARGQTQLLAAIERDLRLLEKK